MRPQKIVLAGGTGFLGRLLIAHWVNSPIELVVLTRKPEEDTDQIRYVNWDGQTLGRWATEIDGADVLINLSGRSVDCRYTNKNKQEILASRIDSTLVLAQAIQNAVQPPGLWINLASATIYRHSLDQKMDEETGKIGESIKAYQFSVDVCRQWEAAFWRVNTQKTRKVALRTAIVLGKQAGVFPVLKRLAQFGLGGRMGSGKQFISWLHEADFVRIVDFIIARDELSGVYNAAGPNPVRNEVFMQLLRQSFGIPVGLPSTEWMLTIGTFFLQTEPELVLKSRYVIPTNLLNAGFKFQFPKVEDAMIDLVKR